MNHESEFMYTPTVLPSWVLSLSDFHLAMIRTLIQRGGLAVIDMADSAGLNAIDAQFAESLAHSVETIREARDVRVVLLRSSGRCFGVGGNVSWFDVRREGLSERIEMTLSAMARAIEGLRSLPALVVTAVNGVAAGGSLGLLFAADLVIASFDARFSAAYAKIGATPDAATSYFLTRLLGERRALELLLLSETFDAAKAQELGLVNFVAKHAEFDSACNRLVERLLSGPSAAFAGTKRLVQSAAGSSLSDHMQTEARTFVEITRTRDFIEGVGAFLDKRQPEFTGH